MTTRIFKTQLFVSLLFGSSLFAIDPPSHGAASPGGPATIALAWTDSVDGETGFRIYRDGSPVADLPAGSTYYYDRSLNPETSYSYEVRSLHGATESAPLVLGSAATTIRMNIIFFLADDMGVKDIVALRNRPIDGPTIHETPALDILAGQSMVIDNAYCSGPRCVVARRSLLTGTYDWNPEVVGKGSDYLDPGGNSTGGGVPIDAVTYGEAAQGAGYRTCYIGKYHLGQSDDSIPRGPAQQGFDVSIAAGHAGAPSSNPTNGLSYFPDPNTLLYEDLSDPAYNMGPGTGLTVPAANGEEYLTDRLTDEGIDFINDSLTNHSTSPFFLTLAHYAVHTPAEAKQSDIDYFTARKTSMADELANHPAGTGLIRDYSSATRVVQDNRVYAAMMKSYDDSIADLRAHLAATSDPRHPGKTLAETTVLVVSSDHGGKSTSAYGDGVDPSKDLEDDATDPVNTGDFSNAYSAYPTSNYPLRQGKTWVYEGGLRIPLIVHVPGLTSASVSKAFVHGADFWATFADLTGAAQQPAEARDSESFMLSAGQPTRSARPDLHHFFTNANVGTANPALGAYRKGDYKLLYFMVQRRLELYNLAADPYERNDLAPSRPDLAAEMLDALYQKVLSAGTKMPKPGSNSWQSEQRVLIDNAVINQLPTPPDAAPSGLVLTQLSDHAIHLDWTINATNATRSIIYRSGPDERALNGGTDSYREIGFVLGNIGTYVDDNFSSGDGEKYKYRVESENLGGWNGFTIDPGGQFSDGNNINGTTNTGNVTLTLNTGAVSPALTLVDDAITILPGETLTFDPRLNDFGDGPLSISAITQPASGSATTDGSSITFSAPESFAGGVTMIYTAIDGAAQTANATVTFTLPVPPADEVIEQWDFDDASGVQLESCLSANGTGFTGTTSDKVACDGAGNLLLQQDTTDHFRTTTNYPGAPFTTGRFAWEIAVDSIDFTQSPNGVTFGFSLRDEGGNDFGNIRFRKNAGTLVLENRIGSSNERLYDFDQGGGAVTTASDLLVRAILDLDTRKWSGTLTIAGGSPIPLPELDADTAATGGLALTRFQGNQTSTKWGAGDTASIDRVTLRRLTAEVSLYEQWSTGQPWNGVLETMPEDDPDGDGMVNLLEFALGTSPTSGAHGSPVTVQDSGTGPALRFVPVRNTTSLLYFVQSSVDLNDWVSIPEVPITAPAGSLVEVDLPNGGIGFGRVRVAD
ncbi:sulfatase-like hydrolase/transferase [Haloferula rosea]|uniref:Sulfatase-like hydrolase/transferase n=1 Tax=Haloferula rosea TaxID=490093 RepID=A0A934R9S4_9BACT|nr:sulfatase-like hydrolase/transferase [Haloferula rosea]MBK1825687.1 sulfatase-like hydrolase/transferase [Haloferula rosea]